MPFTYSNNASLAEAGKALLDKSTADNPFFKAFPVTETPYAQVMWDREKSTFGLTQGRGYNGAAPPVPGLGVDRKTLMPGVYGEHLPIDEYELTVRAQPATFNIPVSINDLIMRRTKQGMTRAINRMLVHIVTLLTTGRYVAKDVKGAVIHDEAVTVQAYAPAVLWSTAATATPWLDFQNVALYDIGLSVGFNGSALAVMNQYTFNLYRQNQNQADIAGRKTKFGATYNGLGEIQELHQDDGLPRILVWNDTYLDDSNVAQRYLPNGYVVVLGFRPDGSRLGMFALTKNVNNPDEGSQLYYHVNDHQNKQPRYIEVHFGFNGGLAIEQPESVVVMKVA